MAEKERWLKNDLVDERVFLETSERKKSMRVKHRAEKEESSNSKIIYIRESSCSPRPGKTKRNSPTLSEKLGKFSLIDDYVAKPERNVKPMPRREIDDIEETKRILSYRRNVKDYGDNAGEKNVRVKQSVRIRNKQKSKLTAALVSNCSYIPGVDNTYNKYHTAYTEERKESDGAMAYNCQSALWW